MKLLSVIIPSYNSEDYIDRCLSSLEVIKRKDIEFLIINDGSTDSTEQIVNKFIKRDNRFKIFKKENGGYCSAINKGIGVANGEYIMFLGSDDELIADAMNRVCVELNEKKPDLLYFGTLKVYDNGKEEQDPFTIYNDKFYSKTTLYDLHKESGKKTSILFRRDTSRCYKRSLVGDLRYYGKTGISSDGCFAILVASKAKVFQFSSEICYKWHLRDDSLSARKKNKTVLMDELEVWDQFFEQIKILYPNKRVAKPIVYYIWSNLVAYKELKKLGIEKEKIEPHRKKMKNTFRWFSTSKYLLLRERIIMRFPFLFWFKIKK
ncbi:MAG: glycosyltransferase family 2 protein [Bacilli bacterium]|jgi:glycosyltransferase involved in cell wall biosynthesis|nr:glycosyltransferase family 2 protein [Bacilli bacterium]